MGDRVQEDGDREEEKCEPMITCHMEENLVTSRKQTGWECMSVKGTLHAL